MKSNAAGQLFGYSLQFPRALLRLLESGIGAKVGIEVCGDVSVFFPEGITLTEEDKSTLTGDALADSSINLWKTFYNWITAINNNEMNSKTDHFVLYTNHAVLGDSVVMKFHNAKTSQDIDSAIQFATEKLKKTTNKQILSYKDSILNNLVLLKEIISQFELIADNKADDVYDSIKIEIRKKLVREDDIEYLLNALTGWFQNTINYKIANNQPAIVSFSDLEHKFLSFVTSIRNKQKS
jgi:hypothetical protein